jgi:hypothetical protein
MKGNIVEMNKQYAELRKQESTVQKKIRDLVSRQKVIDDLELVSVAIRPSRSIQSTDTMSPLAELEIIDRP